MPTEAHKVVLTKAAQNNLNAAKINKNIQTIVSSINSRALAIRGWTITLDQERSYGKGWTQEFAMGQNYNYLYRAYLLVNYEGPRTPESNEMNSIIRTLSKRVTGPAFGKWQVSELDGESFIISFSDEDGLITGDAVGYAPVSLPPDWDDHFEHLFGLDDQIARVRRSLEAGILSNWENRYHSALVGPPGCGKSDICQSIKRAVGEEAVLEFDATSTTAAGAIKELSERDPLPRILLVEEIEKADEKAMSFLLSVLDLRSQIRKTTARSTIIRDTKLFAIATVNDVALFNRLQAGALASRFSNKIWFKRPNREQLGKILLREVNRMDGDEAWIEPTLDYCTDHEISDPRQVSAICLCGRDMLLSGEYQRMLSSTSEEENY
jgi:hypothetical protein